MTVTDGSIYSVVVVVLIVLIVNFGEEHDSSCTLAGEGISFRFLYIHLKDNMGRGCGGGSRGVGGALSWLQKLNMHSFTTNDKG